jgi:hypothetical protein
MRSKLLILCGAFLISVGVFYIGWLPALRAQRPVVQELEFERHVNVFTDGDTITCMVARDYTGMAMACDWREAK